MFLNYFVLQRTSITFRKNTLILMANVETCNRLHACETSIRYTGRKMKYIYHLCFRIFRTLQRIKDAVKIN